MNNSNNGNYTKPRKSGGNFRSGPIKNNKNNLKPGLKGFLVVLNLNKTTNKSEKIDELYTFFEKFALDEDSTVDGGNSSSTSVSTQRQSDSIIQNLAQSLVGSNLNQTSGNSHPQDNGILTNEQLPTEISEGRLSSPLPNRPFFVPGEVQSEPKSTKDRLNSAGDNISSTINAPSPSPATPNLTSAANSSSEGGSQYGSSSTLSQAGSIQSEINDLFSPEVGGAGPGPSPGKAIVKRKAEENRNSTSNKSFSSSAQSSPTPSGPSTPSRRVSIPNGVDNSPGSGFKSAGGGVSSPNSGGGNKTPTTPLNPNSPAKTLTKQQIKRKQFYQMQAATQNMPKPQIHFTKPVVNDDSPFMPKLPAKPNAIKALDLKPVKDSKSGRLYFEHPYNEEIDRWIPSKDKLLSRTEQRWQVKKLSETSYHVVHTLQSLNMMMRDLRAVTEIAFDVEHSDRSYFGLTCLIQISTRFKDYLVDCFSLRDYLHCLNDIFTDPNVLKVAHSAHCDVTYLQKDFGVYLVGLFDTSEAEKVATDSKQAVGLAALLMKYLNVEADKKYQLADWRIRPLPKPMVDYARSDSHFLLNLYDLQKDAIFDKYCNDPDGRGRQALSDVYENSKGICRIRYEKPDLTDWVNKSRKHFTNQQMYALTELNDWRIRVAKKEDDGLYYIASNKTLMLLAEVLPKTRMEMIEAVRKARTGHITDFIFHDMAVISQIMETAKSLPMIVPKDEEVQRKVVGPLITTQVAHLVFFKAKLINHAQVVYKIMDEYKGDNVFASPNYVQRIIPIHTTCERDNGLIADAVRTLLLTNSAFLDNNRGDGAEGQGQSPEETKFYEISCNFPYDKQHELITSVQKAVSDVRADLKYTEDKSDICIIVYSISKMCGVSIVSHYRKFNEFYLVPPTEIPNHFDNV